MTECNKDCANYKPIEKPEPSAKQPCFRCAKCGKPALYTDFGLMYCPECAKLAKLTNDVDKVKAEIERLNAAPTDKECERLAQVAASKSLQWPTDSIPYADFSRIATLLRSMKHKRVEWELKDNSAYFHIADLTWTFDSLDGCCIRQLLAHLGIESVERKEKQA